MDVNDQVFQVFLHVTPTWNLSHIVFLFGAINKHCESQHKDFPCHATHLLEAFKPQMIQSDLNSNETAIFYVFQTRL